MRYLNRQGSGVGAGGALAGGPGEAALGHRRGLGQGASGEDCGTDPLDAGVVGGGRGGQLGEVTGEPLIGRQNRQGPVREPLGAAGQVGELRRQRGSGGRLQVCGVPVIPAAVQAPDVADDELGLVIDGRR